jgi:hypothetical protein
VAQRKRFLATRMWLICNDLRVWRLDALGSVVLDCGAVCMQLHDGDPGREQEPHAPEFAIASAKDDAHDVGVDGGLRACDAWHRGREEHFPRHDARRFEQRIQLGVQAAARADSSRVVAFVRESTRALPLYPMPSTCNIDASVTTAPTRARLHVARSLKSSAKRSMTSSVVDSHIVSIQHLVEGIELKTRVPVVEDGALLLVDYLALHHLV